ncbi:regenerating islet-derived protein 3-gamma-like [Piliocolobus tephrosceles]|uniref:regenerating islet-derived protein 3-gamma-like n=1 Tax=Piliocolobus tephrosceles TaxID=591936 RepID=UPI000C29B766|nr:regenerating islet-derived protein 3-gamma-like [Piliocolobus tephrosceles]
MASRHLLGTREGKRHEAVGYLCVLPLTTLPLGTPDYLLKLQTPCCLPWPCPAYLGCCFPASCFCLRFKVKNPRRNCPLRGSAVPKAPRPMAPTAMPCFCHHNPGWMQIWPARNGPLETWCLCSVGLRGSFVSFLVRSISNRYSYVWIGLHDPTQGSEPDGDG